MEHLLNPGEEPAIRIPYYQQRPDDNGYIATDLEYLQMIGIVVDPSRARETKWEVSNGDVWLDQSRNGRVYTLCHRLLNQFYFGRIHRILGSDLETVFTEEYLGGTVYLTTTALERHLKAWSLRIASMEDAKEKRHIQSQCTLMVEQSYLVLNHLDRSLGWLYLQLRTDEEPLGRTHLACALLHEALVQAFAGVFDKPSSDWLDLSGDWDRLHLKSESPWLRRRMESDGWCPYAVSRLSDLLSTEVMVYAFHLETTKGNVDGSHRGCDRNMCFARNALPGDNIGHPSSGIRHVNARCSCFTIPAPIDDIRHIRQSSGIPTLKIGTDDGYKLSLYARNASDSKYVAISHELGDGIGSQKSKSIAQCQLTRIADRLGYLEDRERCGELNIYLDALCNTAISVRDYIAESRDDLMHHVFTDAYAVIVMDAYFLNMPRYASAAEVGIRLYLSTFSTHLWKFQEGLLASRLLLMTLDGLLDVDEVLSTLTMKTKAKELGTLQRNLLRTLAGSVRARIGRPLAQPVEMYDG